MKTKRGELPRRFTPEDLFRHAKPAGVNRAVLVQMSYYYPKDPASSVIGRGFDNSYMLAMIAKHPGVKRVVNPDMPVDQLEDDPRTIRSERLSADGPPPCQM